MSASTKLPDHAAQQVLEFSTLSTFMIITKTEMPIVQQCQTQHFNSFLLNFASLLACAITEDDFEVNFRQMKVLLKSEI